MEKVHKGNAHYVDEEYEEAVDQYTMVMVLAGCS